MINKINNMHFYFNVEKKKKKAKGCTNDEIHKFYYLQIHDLDPGKGNADIIYS